VVAIGLLIVYHIAIVFMPFASQIGFPQNDRPLTAIWILMSALNVWRIPLLFVVSGMGVAFAMRRRDGWALVKDRTHRILLPLVFGSLLVSPIHVWLSQRFYGVDEFWAPSMGHLWFLLNIYLYVLLGLPALLYFRRHPDAWLIRGLRRGLSRRWLILLVVLPMAAESVLVIGHDYPMYAMTLHGLALGALCFYGGVLAIQVDGPFWSAVEGSRWLCLILAVLGYLLRMLTADSMGLHALTAIESTCWMLAIFGFASRHLNYASRTIRYLSGAVYTVYITHMAIFFALALWWIPLPIATGDPMVPYSFPAPISSAPVSLLRLAAMIVLTGAGTLLSYEIIRRIPLLRDGFGASPPH
jgi:hypothetical protein